VLRIFVVCVNHVDGGETMSLNFIHHKAYHLLIRFPCQPGSNRETWL
jgi:hypothetical protein